MERLRWMDGHDEMLAFCFGAWNPKVSRVDVAFTRPWDDANELFCVGTPIVMGGEKLAMAGGRRYHVKPAPSVRKRLRV